MPPSRAAAAAATATATARTVQTVIALDRDATKVAQLMRTDRRLELLERALAAAQESSALCEESTLLLASLLESLGNARMAAILIRDFATRPDAIAAAFPLIHEDVAMGVHLRALELLHARFRAGTIFTPTADETTYFEAKNELPLLAGPETFLTLAKKLTHAPGIVPPRTPVEEEDRLRYVHGALRSPWRWTLSASSAAATSVA